MAVAAALLIAAAEPAAAEPAPTAAEPAQLLSAPWQLRALLGTAVPIDVGLGATLEAPFGLRVGTSVGYVPGPYVDLINAVATRLEFYDDATADLISAVLQRSLVWNLRAGWRPWSQLTVDAGYSLITLGGSASSQDVLAALSSTPPPSGGDDTPYEISSTLHMLHLEVGWRFDFGRLSVRPAIGAAVTVSAHTTVDPGETGMPVRDRSRRAFGAGVAGYLDDTYKRYVHTPLITVTAGYRFDL
ncbi:MAG: hypothetical protein Tsb0020_55480 [Haliangiales bacterium]